MSHSGCRKFLLRVVLADGILKFGLLLLLLSVATHIPARAQSAPSVVGEWSGVQTWPYRAMHAQLLPTGKVIFWDSYSDADFPQLWDPTTGTITPATQVGYNIFCTGFSLLPNGRMMVLGGHYVDNWGLPTAATYDPFTDAWTRLPDMNDGRWYPTVLTLSNGDVLVVSGMADTSSGMNLLPQVWQASSGNWRNLTNAQLQLPYYPYMFQTPNGKVFNAGPNQTTRYLDTTGAGSWTVVGNNNYGTRNWGSAVMYDDGKVLILGGIRGDFYGSTDQTPTATTEIIDLNLPSPSWQFAPPMFTPRKHPNATLLPDGKVLVTGGSSGSEYTTDNSASPAYAAEMWDPATNTWTVLASNTVYRGYHATALLLPDGRVLSAGGNFSASAEIFSPPYLFKGARPTITSAPTTVGYGQTFFVGSLDATSITNVNWVRLSSVTHTNNMGQRINHLTFSQTTGGLNITAPSSSQACTPGYYMLFILNTNGVPSIAKIIRIDSSTVTAPATPSNLTAAAASASQINLSWTDNSSNEDGFRVERCQGTTCTNFAEVTQVASGVTSYNNTGLTSNTTYRYRVQAFNSGGSSAYSNIASATTSQVPPAAPSNLTATTASASQINLSWTDNSTNENGFRIERCQGTTCTNFAEITQVASGITSYNNTGLTAGTTYRYRVQAFNGGGSSAYSNIATATTAQVVPVAPSNLAAVGSGLQINLSWNDNSSNEEGFRIERSFDNITFNQIATVPANQNTYTDASFPLPGIYYYRVRAYNSAGNSPYSNTASATTAPQLPQPPAAPSGLNAVAVSTSRVDLLWTDNSANEGGFQIDRSFDGVIFTPLVIVQNNTTNYSDRSVVLATTYYYRIRAFGITGISAYSNIASATPVPAGALPAAPTNLSANLASTTQVNLSWTDNANNESGFQVERSNDGNTFTQIATTGANVSTYSDTGLVVASTYYYRVRAYNSAGNSTYSNTAAVSAGCTFPCNAILDNFNRSDEGPPPSTSWGGIIVPGGDGLKVNNNQVIGVLNNTSTSYWGIAFNSDVEAYVSLSGVDFGSGIWLRVANPAQSNFTGYLVFAYNTLEVIRVFRRNSDGTYVQLGPDIPQQVSLGDSLGATMIGSTLTIYYRVGPGAWTNLATRSDNMFSGTRLIGMESADNTSFMDNFGGGNR